MSERTTLLTDDQINEIADTLKMSISEESQKVRDLKNMEDTGDYPYNTVDKPELIEAEMLVEVNQETGEQRVIGPVQESNLNVKLGNIIDGSDTEIRRESAITDDKANTLKEFGLTDEDSLSLLSIINRYKNKEKFNIFKELPKSIQRTVMGMCGSTDIRDLQACSRILLDQFISEFKLEEEFINFQESLNKELNIPGLTDMYDEHLKNTMEKELLEKADLIESKDPEKANVLRAISSAYTDSYNMTSLIQAVENKEPAAKRLDKAIRNYSKHCRDFNFKYSKSKFKINNIELVAATLDRVLPSEIPSDEIRKFVVLFCRICTNKDSNNPIDHAFMYYSIKNILSLDFAKPESEMYKTLTNNIIKIIDLINS